MSGRKAKVLRKLFDKTFGAAHDSGRLPNHSPKTAADLARISSLVEFFPIGKKLRYYPEFNKDIVLDTLVVAYCINGHFVYAMESIETDRDGTPTAFRAFESEVRIAASGLKSFQ